MRRSFAGLIAATILSVSLGSTFAQDVPLRVKPGAPPPPETQNSYFWCEPARAYYPYVKQCAAPWRQVTSEQIQEESAKQEAARQEAARQEAARQAAARQEIARWNKEAARQREQQQANTPTQVAPSSRIEPSNASSNGFRSSDGFKLAEEKAFVTTSGEDSSKIPTGLMVLGILAGIYFFPTIIAGANRHHNAGAIFVLNLFLGWTFLGWVVALVWGCTKPRPA